MRRKFTRALALILALGFAAALASCDPGTGQSTNNAFQRVSNSIP